jgi:hypothetical protein
MESNDKKLYEAALKMTEKYSGALKKHLLLAIGAMLYIAFVVMAMFFYRPSYFACISIGGTVWSLLNSVVNALFVTMFVFFMFQGLLPEDFLLEFRVALPNILFICMIYLLVSYSILLYRCRDTAKCNTGECNFNDRVLTEVNKSKRMKEIHEFYKRQMGTRRTSIGACSNYYNASYAEAAPSSCNPSSGGTLCNISLDPAVGAPVLAEFFVMTSGRTCVVGPQYDGYMSTHMIAIALTGGARCLNFDVSANGYGVDPTPIVTNARDRDNTNLQRNFVLLEDCFKTVMRYWYGASSVVGNVPKRDPIFIHLNLRRSMTTKCMDAVAKLINYYFNQYMGEKLLGEEYHHGNLNIGEIPICMLFNKVIIIVNSPYRTPSTLLDPMINAYAGTLGGASKTDGTIKNHDWSTVKNSSNARDDYVKYNRKHLTYVETSHHPYMPISNTLKPGEGGVSSDSRAKYTTRDGMTDFILNKQTINNNPIVPLQYGCQFVAMNFQNLDSDMNLYMGFFKNSSLLLKPKVLRREPLMTVSAEKYGACSAASVALSNTSVDNKCQKICLPENDAQTFQTNPETTNWSRADCDLSIYTENDPPTTTDFGGNSIGVMNFSKPI